MNASYQFFGATTRRALEHVSWGTASADHNDFSQISTSIDLKLKIKRQGQAKGRKWGLGTDHSLDPRRGKSFCGLEKANRRMNFSAMEIYGLIHVLKQ